MISGGDGGLAIEMQMDQYELINEDTPCATVAEANDIAMYMAMLKYSEFQVTQQSGKFYIWKKVSE